MARTRTTVLLLVVASLALILWDLRASQQSLRSAAQQIVAPLQRTATAVFAPFGAWARDVQQFSDPVARTSAAAQIPAPAGWTGVPARVVAADIAGDRAAVTIDAGSRQGLAEGNAVLAAGGVVGRISRVNAGSATVLLVSDPASAVGVRLLPSKEMGVATGQGRDANLRVDLLSPAAEAGAGDTLVTLGSDSEAGVPPGLPIGRITAVDVAPTASGRTAEARPVAGMTSLETVLVLTGRR
jgi:cell shape-determining protein MreC